MELPHLGKQCTVQSCKQLDFLPVKCDSCQQIFCMEHFQYEEHHCPEAYKKDNQVPVCPLCNIPIPVKKGEAPDLIVGQHIDTDCQSDPAKERRGKIFTNRCGLKGCKSKELIPFNCTICQKNFCLRHRNELDHECKGFEGTGRAGSKAGAAAAARFGAIKPAVPKTTSTKPKTSKPQTSQLSSLGRDLDRERRDRQQQPTRGPAPNMRAMQANMSEDEAMARALAMSMADTPGNTKQNTKPPTEQEEEDAALAQALALSEQEATRQQRARLIKLSA